MKGNAKYDAGITVVDSWETIYTLPKTFLLTNNTFKSFEFSFEFLFGMFGLWTVFYNKFSQKKIVDTGKN